MNSEGLTLSKNSEPLFVLVRQTRFTLSMSQPPLAHLLIVEVVYRVIEAYRMSREAFYSSMSLVLILSNKQVLSLVLKHWVLRSSQRTLENSSQASNLKAIKGMLVSTLLSSITTISLLMLIISGLPTQQ